MGFHCFSNNPLFFHGVLELTYLYLGTKIGPQQLTHGKKEGFLHPQYMGHIPLKNEGKLWVPMVTGILWPIFWDRNLQPCRTLPVMIP